MSQHSIAETKDNLSALIGRAEKGEEIVVTRHGKPVARISGMATRHAPKRMTKADIDWLEKNRVQLRNTEIDSVALVRQMRDEDWP